MKYLLDTNICIHWLHGKREIAEAIDKVGLSACAISEITKAELLFGEELAIKRGRNINPQPLRRLLTMLEIIPISEAIEVYASEKARLASAGLPIEDFDLFIACTAVEKGLVLVSEDMGHMSRIQGVRLENWADPISDQRRLA